VADQIQRDLAEMISEVITGRADQFRDGVEVSPDYAHAKVYRRVRAPVDAAQVLNGEGRYFLRCSSSGWRFTRFRA
jgi:ribosome-binding factor A